MPWVEFQNSRVIKWLCLNAATISGSLVNASGCPTESRHRSAWTIGKICHCIFIHAKHITSEKILMINPNRAHLFGTSHAFFHMKIALRSKFNLTCGYPPCATALTSASFSSAIIDSFNTGGVRKSECRTSLLDDARLAYDKHESCTNYIQKAQFQ